MSYFGFAANAPCSLACSQLIANLARMKVPTLRIHESGNYFVKWGGRVRYLGRDKSEAEERFLDEIAAWREWRKSRKTEKARASRAYICILDLADQFIHAKIQENGSGCGDFYEKHLKRFLSLFGKFDCNLIKPTHLNALKVHMLSEGFAAKTVNHDMTAVKTMLNWASGLDLVAPVSFKGIKNLPLGPTADHAITIDSVREAFEKAPAVLRPFIAINYLALLRPSEVVRISRGEFTPHKSIKGVIVLNRGKMDKRASIKRHCIFSDEAMGWLSQVTPRFSRLDSYSQACRLRAGVSPKVFQKSAASHLVQLHGVSPADVELLLGHVTGRLSVTYYLPAFERLRDVAAALSLA